MPALATAPLTGWNIRGWSYGQRQDDGQLHPGADLNFGYGDQDLGLSVVSFADGEVVWRQSWDGSSYGYGNYGMVRHRLGELDLWSLYAHLDGFHDNFQVGYQIKCGEELGWCGKTGRQPWAHLHFELRYRGPDKMAPWYWGGRLDIASLSELYADPFTLLRVLGALPAQQPQQGPASDLAAVQADRDYNHDKALAFEANLRDVEQLVAGRTDRVLAEVNARHGR